MNPRISIMLVAVMSITTVAIGLRFGARDPVRAALVIGAPLPRGGGRAAWQVRTQEDDGHLRTAIITHIVARVRARGVERTFDTTTNLDGVAELAFEAPDLATGDRIEIDVRDASTKAVLARGDAAWPKDPLAPIIASDIKLRPSRVEGAVKMSVAVLGGALAPGQSGRVWIHGQSSALSLNVEATPDMGIEIAAPFQPARDVACPHDGFVELTARGLTGGVTFRAKDSEEHTGEWYGALPVAPGAMHLEAPVHAEPGAVQVVLRSGGARTLAYVEVDDDHGRVAAQTVELAGEPPFANVSLEMRTPGLGFIVVSGVVDGAEAMTGATRAFPIWIGPNAPCEMSLAGQSGRAFPRFVALDGFIEKRAMLAARKKRGRLIALVGLALGSLLETLLLLRAARDGKRELQNVQNAILDGGETATVQPTKRRGLLDVVVMLMLSLLGFVLLFALVDFATR